MCSIMLFVSMQLLIDIGQDHLGTGSARRKSSTYPAQHKHRQCDVRTVLNSTVTVWTVWQLAVVITLEGKTLAPEGCLLRFPPHRRGRQVAAESRRCCPVRWTTNRTKRQSNRRKTISPCFINPVSILKYRNSSRRPEHQKDTVPVLSYLLTYLITYLLTYSLTHSLHAAQSFLRS